MKVLIVNTSEQTGGAAIAARRLTESLRTAGVDARLLVMHRESRSPLVTALKGKWRKRLAFLRERLVIWACNLLSRRNLFAVSIANTGFDITRLAEFRQADVIHLHWTQQGMLSLAGLRRILQSGKPVVWTLHDMWPLTGICHHAHTCQAFKSRCHHCPLLRLPGAHDLAARTFSRKQRILDGSGKQPHIVAVSRWLAAQARESALLGAKEISVVPNTLCLDDFPLLPDRRAARAALGLPQEKRLILFGAARIDDPIKGLPHLLAALRLLAGQGGFSPGELHLVLFGTVKHPRQALADVPVPYTCMGRIADTRRLARLYAAADVTVSASLYETFGQTLIEAQACGCIPVSFGNSGQADIISHLHTGYLADYLSAPSLAEGIRWALTEGARTIPRERLRQNVERNYAARLVAQQYIGIYKKQTENA